MKLEEIKSKQTSEFYTTYFKKHMRGRNDFEIDIHTFDVIVCNAVVVKYKKALTEIILVYSFNSGEWYGRRVVDGVEFLFKPAKSSYDDFKERVLELKKINDLDINSIYYDTPYALVICEMEKYDDFIPDIDCKYLLTKAQSARGFKNVS
jgi:hypothetical protein